MREACHSPNEGLQTSPQHPQTEAGCQNSSRCARSRRRCLNLNSCVSRCLNHGDQSCLLRPSSSCVDLQPYLRCDAAGRWREQHTSVRAGFLVILLIGCIIQRPVQAVVCYSTKLETKLTTLALGVQPEKKIFGVAEDVFRLNKFMEQDFIRSLSNEMKITHLDACFVSCEGPTKETAVCSFSGTRYAVCLMMMDQRQILMKNEEFQTNSEWFYNFCWVPRGVISRCDARKYWEVRCCTSNECNVAISEGSHQTRTLVFASALAVVTLVINSFVLV